MKSQSTPQIISRAPANGAPSRYAAVLALRVGGPDSGGSTPLATALRHSFAIPHLANESVTLKSKSVTHVLNLKCYLCIDRTLRPLALSP